MIRINRYIFFIIIVAGVVLSLFLSKTVLISAREAKIDDWYLQANRAYYAGDLLEAIDQYEKILQYESTGRALLNLAIIYEELGDYAEASKYYLTYVTYAPEDQQARLDLAIAYYNLEQITEAEEALNYFTQLDSIEPHLEREVAYYLSKTAERRGDYTTSLEYAKESLGSDPIFTLSMVQKGRIYELLGETNAAINSFLGALRIDGSLKGLHRRLGLLYLEQEDYQRAYYRFAKAVQENKRDLLAKNKLEWLEEEYPGEFTQRSTPTQPKDFPESVNFINISPLAESAGLKQLRVGLAGGLPQKAVIFRVGSDFLIKDEADLPIASGKVGEIWMAEKTEHGQQLSSYPDGQPITFSSSIKIEPVDYAPILIHQVEFGAGVYWAGKQDRQYRGQIELIPNREGITIINLVNPEEYLFAVVASEMPASWPLEALKVQAVAARTYTQFNLGKHGHDSFDLCDTVHCTAYNGIAWERKKTRQAVIETSGQILTYQDRPINAVYSANSGGHTEDAKDVWGFDLPYLKAVSTLKNSQPVFPLEPAELKEWLRKSPAAYSADQQFTKGVHYRWQRKVEKSFIEDRLNIGNLTELQVLGRGKGGSVTSILVVGDRGEVELKHSLRSNLGGLRSNRFFLRPEYENGQLTGYLFYGGGWGHSAGMDQVAAAGMAKEGFTYTEILKHFYTGIELLKTD